MHITVFGATGGTGTQFVHQALAAGHHVTAVVRDPSRLVLPSDPEALETRRSGAGPAPDAVEAYRSGAGLAPGAVETQGSGAGLAPDALETRRSGARLAPDATQAGAARASSGRPGEATAGPRGDDGIPAGAAPADALPSSHADDRLRVVVADVMDAQAIEGVVAEADAVVSAMGHRGKGPTTVCGDSIASVLRAARVGGTRRIVMVSAAGMVVDDGDGPVTRYLVKPILGRVLRDAFIDMRAAEARLWDNDLDWTIVRPPMLTDKPWTGTYRVSLDRNVRGGRTIARADLADCLLRAIPDRTTVRRSVAVAY